MTDALVLELLGYVDATSLGRLSCVSKALYCFCGHEDLWKAAVFEVCRAGTTSQ